MHGERLCVLHDPEQGRAARSAGGHSRAAHVLSKEEAASIKLADPRAVPATLEMVARWAATGAMETRVANAIAVCAATAIRASDSADLARRLDVLEAAFPGARRMR
jgi:hypothetical protein